MKTAPLAALVLAAAFCMKAGAQELVVPDRKDAFKSPPVPIAVAIKEASLDKSVKQAVSKLDTFASVDLTCYGGEMITVLAKGICRTAEEWSAVAEKKCANSCAKVQDKEGHVTVKCGVNSFALGKRCGGGKK